MTGDERDPILDRLGDADPARLDPGDEALVRAEVKRRGKRVLGPPGPPKRFRRTGLVIAGAGGLAAAALVIVLAGGGDGLQPGPERALAIQNGPNGVALRIEDGDASAEEMNQELEAAGIDQVRVFSVPGSPNHAGTWAGEIFLGAKCGEMPYRPDYGIRIPLRVLDTPPAPGRDFLDLELPQGPRGSGQAVAVVMGTMSSSGQRAVVSTEAEEGPAYALSVLLAIRSRQDDDEPDAKTFGVEELAALGGDFEVYAQALSDGRANCEELGLEPRSQEPSSEGTGKLLRGGPVMGRCVVKVLGTGLFSIEGEVTGRDARRIHACSKRLQREVRREHARHRARRHRQIDWIDSEAELPAFVRARLDRGPTEQRAPHGGVKPNMQGIDTGTVVLVDPDGHDHRTSPKRRGEYVNLLCAARGGEDREFHATTFFEGEPIANARASCRAHGPWSANHVVKVRELGVYEIHLNGAGFEDFVIRAPTTSKPDRPRHR